jgi:hypothetical protein
MSVREIIYLDEATLASFVSQSRGFLEEFATEADSAERAMDLVRFSAEAEQNRHSSIKQTSLRQGRFLDARWTRYLDEIGEHIVDLDDGKDVKVAANSALSGGKLVRATGTFFLDDFGWIRASLNNLPKFFDLQERQQRVEFETQLAIFDALKTSGAQRNQVEAEKQKLKAKMAATSAHTKAQLGMYTLLTELVTAMYGDGVECGVALSGTSPIAVRGVLDRTWLREAGPTLIQRYGSRSSVGFTIVGLVTRLSWSERMHLSDEERKGWEMVQEQQASGEESSVSTTSVRGAVGAAQAIMESMHEMLMSRSAEQAIFVSPLAIYRPVALPESSTKTGSAQ